VRQIFRQRLQFRDQRGSVLPLAMIILLILSAVLSGLALLTGQEPLVAGNHLTLAQAQAMAEAAIERALWALSNPDSPDGIAWPAPAPAPYDGSRFIAVVTESGAALGGFRLAVTGEGDRQRQVVATGLVPGDDGPLGRARQEISATVIRLRFPDPPAGLTVRGDLVLGSGVSVDAAGYGSCEPVAGTWSTGSTTLEPGSQVRGSAGAVATPNEPSVDFAEHQSPDLFDQRSFTPAELNALKAVARARGTYFRGSATFDTTRPPDHRRYPGDRAGDGQHRRRRGQRTRRGLSGLDRRERQRLHLGIGSRRGIGLCGGSIQPNRRRPSDRGRDGRTRS
jgi:hypothetical protein